MKKSVRFKMPAYDFVILSCSLNIFSQETEKVCMIYFMKKNTYQDNFPRSTTFYVQTNSYGHSMELAPNQSHHCTMCILGSTMALWSKAEIQKYTFWWEKNIFEAIFPMLF